MAAAAISTSTISLVIFGLSLIVMYNIDAMSNELIGQVEIRAFLDRDISEPAVNDMKERILHLDHVKSCEYISPARALDKLQEDLGIDFMYLPRDNPLPPALVVKVNDPRQIGIVADKMREFDGVNDTLYGKSILQKLLRLSMIIKLMGYFLTMLMGAGAMLTIMNTIRLTVLARREEIRTMQLVGATGWFIRWPFLLEGITLGLIGACVAGIVLALTYTILHAKITTLLPNIFPMVPTEHMVRTMLIMLLYTGALMGMAGSYISTARFIAEKSE